MASSQRSITRTGCTRRSATNRLLSSKPRSRKTKHDNASWQPHCHRNYRVSFQGCSPVHLTRQRDLLRFRVARLADATRRLASGERRVSASIAYREMARPERFELLTLKIRSLMLYPAELRAGLSLKIRAVTARIDKARAVGRTDLPGRAQIRRISPRQRVVRRPHSPARKV